MGHAQMRRTLRRAFRQVGAAFTRDARRGAALLLVLVAPLTACGLNKVYAPADPGFDYRDRHPVVLAEAPTSVELLPQTMGGVLDSETRRRLLAFVAQYRRFGHGMITMLAPSGGSDPKGATAFRRAHSRLSRSRRPWRVDLCRRPIRCATPRSLRPFDFPSPASRRRSRDPAASGRTISLPALRSTAGRTAPFGISAAPIRRPSRLSSPIRAICSGRAERRRRT